MYATIIAQYRIFLTKYHNAIFIFYNFYNNYIDYLVNFFFEYEILGFSFSFLFFYKCFFKNINMDKKNIDPQAKINYRISPKGSLGLLALGDLGLEAWRKVKRESNKEDFNNEE